MLTSEFEFPTGEGEGDENVTAVDASNDQPAYVVGLGPETVGSAVYRASVLETSGLEGDDATESTVGDGDDNSDRDSDDDGSGETLTPIINEDVNGLDDLPEGWDRDSVLEFWSSMGGSWDACVEEMADELVLEAVGDGELFGDEKRSGADAAVAESLLKGVRWRSLSLRAASRHAPGGG
ncbi:hypothetical protein C483_17393 [Natrialba hulunbeirensis JCM 10989]|uniref:Uncharacterized protein n=1 Tax=Natrialba hulunbeirensis JCM 10989 TaxID=1227493 RepID=L9ZNQ5_9EURY|nr:hypothetical protein C483_17393 [Natrialba hulunbeirensis JCM 10989]